MQKNQKPYPIEVALEKMINEVTLGIRGVFRFFFIIPKNKEDKMIYIIETLAWLLLGLSLILRFRSVWG